MKKIGLVGGLGPSSTIVYYSRLIEKYRNEFGPDNYPEILIDSVNMHDVVENVNNHNYNVVAKILLKSINNLVQGGAEIIGITANTPHIVWNLIKDQFMVPVISIIDAAIAEIKRCSYKKVLVFGTTATMKNGLYANPLRENGIEVVLPVDTDKEEIGKIFYPNLENGIIIEADRQAILKFASKYIAESKANALLLGCTELSLIIKAGDVQASVLDTTDIHVNSLYEKAKEA